jgi:O-antigen/teichoic acid export membrane protein
MFTTQFGNSLLIHCISAAIFTCLLMFLHNSLLSHIPLELLLALALSELFFSPLSQLCSNCFLSFERAANAAAANILLPASRLVVVIPFTYWSESPTASNWAIWYGLASLFATITNLAITVKSLGWPKIALDEFATSLREGTHFALGLASFSVYSDIDKTIMSRLATSQATGLYAASYRMITMASVPVRSLLQASYAKIFVHGAVGIKETLQYARRLLLFSVLYSGLVTIAVVIGAPLVPLLLGEDYQGAATILIWLAPLILLQTFHSFAADILTGAGFQTQRSRIQLLAAGLNLSFGLALIPPFSWRGAAVASLLTDSFLMIALWATVWRHFHAQDRNIDDGLLRNI